jgi:hypothetical protein
MPSFCADQAGFGSLLQKIPDLWDLIPRIDYFCPTKPTDLFEESLIK